MTAGVQLGAPGVFFPPQRDDTPPQDVRLHETGFVGIASRGPVQTPVRVTSWSDYVRWFGGLPNPDRGDPPTSLAYAVDSFFGQGGMVAWVLRVAPPEPANATALYEDAVGDSVLRIAAANEGSWGNLLSVELAFSASAAIPMTTVADPSDATVSLQPLAGSDIAQYSLLRIRHPALAPAGELRWLETKLGAIDGISRVTRYELDSALPLPNGEPVEVAVVTGLLIVTDNDPAGIRSEQLSGLGLHPRHWHFISGVMEDESVLVRGVDIVEPIAPADGLLRPVKLGLATGGVDRWSGITYDSFFDDDSPAEQDPADDDEDHRGVDRMGRVSDIGLICAPDLLWTWRGEPEQTVVVKTARTSGRFVPCRRTGVADMLLTATKYPSTQLDPTYPDDMDEIVRRQLRLVDVARYRARFVALLDVPLGIRAGDVTKWRSAFDSSFAACYYPWLGVASLSEDRATVFLPPSAFAAGIAANREVVSGVQYGPANELASDAIDVSAVLSDGEAADLFALSVNVFRPERDGFRLASARTMSSDPQYWQLSVRRLMTTIALSLQRIGQDLVFEPGSLALRTALLQSVTSLLRELFRRNAFAGNTEADSFFVRCDDSLNDEHTRALGQLIAEVGVAPASPLEFLVVRLTQGVDGTSVVNFGG
jgi:hypothetical protein